MNFRTHSPQINQLFDLATALLVKTGGKSPSSIFKIKFDVTRILNSDSWKDAVLDTIIIKGGDSNLKILILQVLKYSWFYYIIGKLLCPMSRPDQLFCNKKATPQCLQMAA